MKTAREIAEMVNHGNDVDDFERYIEYCELAAANAFDESAAEIERLRAALATETERCAIAARDALNHDGYEETAEFVANAIRTSGGHQQERQKT